MGAGVGGLTAGALLAKAGKKVLVAEREQQAGGYARGLRRGPDQFDTGVHQIMGGVRTSPIGPGLVDAVLLHLGVRDRCELVPMSPMYRVRFPGLQLDVPTGREAFLEAHLRHFPGEEPGLRRLVELSARVCQEVLRFPIAPR